MKKETKNILTREWVANELLAVNKEHLFTMYTFGSFCFIFFSLLTALAISTTLSLPYKIAGGIVFGSIPLLLILDLIHLLVQRMLITHGDFEITTEALLYKSKNPWARRHEYDDVLHFRNFRKFGVHITSYTLATPGDTYYVVHYKNSNRILKIYPTKAYELK